MIHPKIDDEGIASFPGVDEKGSWKVGQTLRIGKIINSRGEEVSSLVLEPQGIAHLVSKTCVHLPDNVCALAHVLTRMCNDGLLTLNIGVVDPGWKNHLSTPVLNFSSEHRLLQLGDPFIRLTYHRIDIDEGADHPDTPRGTPRIPPTPTADYDRAVRARAVGGFGKSFLNIKSLVRKAFKKENARFKDAMLKYLPIGAFSLAFFALLVTIGIAVGARIAASGDQAKILERLDKLESTAQKPVSVPETPTGQGMSAKTVDSKRSSPK